MKKIAIIPFNEAFIDEPVGKKKLSEREYEHHGEFPVVDQGQKDIAGYTNRKDLVRSDVPFIAFGDHTRIVKYINFPFVVGADGLRLFKANNNYNPEYLYYILKSSKIPSDGYGRHSKYLYKIEVPQITIQEQTSIVQSIKQKLDLIQIAKEALKFKLKELVGLSNSLIYDSLNSGKVKKVVLENVLDELTEGIGEIWNNYPVLGATKNGMAKAKEPVGKTPQRYKLVYPGTVFYNPMRILIGSIALVDEGDESGIISPDYVAIKGKDGIVDPRWFYYWLRSPLGEKCVSSLARGAVRERMLFNRLAEGEILLPSYERQVKTSKALKHIKPMRESLQCQLKELELMPPKIFAKYFEGYYA